VWNRFTPLQCLVMALATVPVGIITTTVAARLVGLISTEAMVETALSAGENPGVLVFAAMFLASPVQWLTGRTQVRVRKYLGIVFFLLAAANGAMFVVESGVAAALSAPFLVAGTVALALSVPLFLTSSRWSQRAMGLKRWRLLHKATYVVAAALVAHVLLLPEEVEPGVLAIVVGFILRIPAIRRRLMARGQRMA
jgi:DMSO/TMAO reductase YedYZ heme-binding membrane subunit